MSSKIRSERSGISWECNSSYCNCIGNIFKQPDVILSIMLARLKHKLFLPLLFINSIVLTVLAQDEEQGSLSLGFGLIWDALGPGGINYVFTFALVFGVIYLAGHASGRFEHGKQASAISLFAAVAGFGTSYYVWRNQIPMVDVLSPYILLIVFAFIGLITWDLITAFGKHGDTGARLITSGALLLAFAFVLTGSMKKLTDNVPYMDTLIAWMFLGGIISMILGIALKSGFGKGGRDGGGSGGGFFGGGRDEDEDELPKDIQNLHDLRDMYNKLGESEKLEEYSGRLEGGIASILKAMNDKVENNNFEGAMQEAEKLRKYVRAEYRDVKKDSKIVHSAVKKAKKILKVISAEDKSEAQEYLKELEERLVKLTEIKDRLSMQKSRLAKTTRVKVNKLFELIRRWGKAEGDDKVSIKNEIKGLIKEAFGLDALMAKIRREETDEWPEFTELINKINNMEMKKVKEEQKTARVK